MCVLKVSTYLENDIDWRISLSQTNSGAALKRLTKNNNKSIHTIQRIVRKTSTFHKKIDRKEI